MVYSMGLKFVLLLGLRMLVDVEVVDEFPTRKASSRGLDMRELLLILLGRNYESSTVCGDPAQWC
jgi:hypothetical protein